MLVRLCDCLEARWRRRCLFGSLCVRLSVRCRSFAFVCAKSNAFGVLVCPSVRLSVRLSGRLSDSRANGSTSGTSATTKQTLTHTGACECACVSAYATTCGPQDLQVATQEAAAAAAAAAATAFPHKTLTIANVLLLVCIRGTHRRLHFVFVSFGHLASFSTS